MPWILLLFILIFFGGGIGYYGHPSYGYLGSGGIGLGTILVLVLICLLLTGGLRGNQ